MSVCADCDRPLGSRNRSGYCEACYEARRRKPPRKEGQRAVPFTEYSPKGGAGRMTYVSLPDWPEGWE